MGCQDRHALPAGLVRLKELDIRGASLSLQHISSWTALEVLDAADSDGLKDVALLRPLTRLRHLSLENLRSLSPSSSTSFTVLGAMQQLTHLNLRSVGKNPTPACCAALAGTNPLPALQQLDLSGQEVGSYSALAPWVAKLTALTSLNLSGGKVAEGDELLYLPTQLRELHLAAMEDMGEVPRGVLRLPALELLSLGYNQGLDQLPSWLSELRQLELLDLDNTHIWQEQQVLAQLPALRCITLPYGLWQTPAVLYANVPHLHWGHSDRFISWRGRNYVDR
jgi:Leucine-rich repeat (LRR) protein